MRTIHSANQLSIYGAVSSWCLDLSGRIQGQESTGVNLSFSEENEQLSQQLNPQEVGSLARIPPRTQGAAGNCWQEHVQRFELINFAPYVKRRGCGRWIWEFLFHHAGNTPSLGPTISAEIITVLTRYRPIVLELI